MTGWVLCGDALEVMARLPDNSVEAVVTDPPYGLTGSSGKGGFMGKEWDSGVPGAAFWCEALRVAKPGARLLAMGGTRTFHRLVCAIEDAGWRVMDTLCWMYGSGFPKSHDISKAIDREAGAEREVGEFKFKGGTQLGVMNDDAWQPKDVYDSTPATDAARKWNGWGTALKPAVELICMAMKPLDGTYAGNTLRHGCGGINVDGCRIATDDRLEDQSASGKKSGGTSPFRASPRMAYSAPQGRWPANVILDPDAARMLDMQSGERIHGAGHARGGIGKKTGQNESIFCGDHEGNAARYGDTGGASRFFYCAKASRAERNAGLEGLPQGEVDRYGECGATEAHAPRRTRIEQNRHPTVKPLALMRWLVRLVTPPGGTVLDPFCGSGTTGIAAHQEGMHYILIDNDPESCEIAERRIDHWLC